MTEEENEHGDIFEAPDGDAATKVALLVRSFGHGVTETWVATPWDRFVQLAKEAAK
ncbi:MAG: GYD domain-containing protein [Deltaproteobacteria bacterium]